MLGDHLTLILSAVMLTAGWAPAAKVPIRGLISMGAYRFVSKGGDPVNTLEPLNAKPGIFMKIVFLMLAFAIAAVGQKPTPTPAATPTPCPLTLAEAPAWGTIKLGMSESEFQKLFPRMPFMVNKLDLPETPVFDNVDNMMFTFYKERLEEVTVQFDLSTHWDNIRQFTDSLSGTYKLPNAWTFTLGTGMLQCTEFAMRAVSSRNEVKLRDTLAAKKMQTENPPPKSPGEDTPVPIPTPKPRPTPPH